MNDTAALVIKRAKIQSNRLILVDFAEAMPETNEAIRLEPATPIESVDKKENRWIIQTAENLHIDVSYELLIGNARIPLLPGVLLDGFASAKPLGCVIENGAFVFRVFAPRASTVTLLIFDTPDSTDGEPFSMEKDGDGVWEYAINESLYGKCYGYRVNGPRGATEKFDPAIIIADPYGKAVASQNHYSHPARTLILPPDNFDWEGDSGISIPQHDLIIYEAHLRDLTMHPSSGIDEHLRGSYSGFIQDDRRGGIAWLKKLGVNALELLPVQGFGTFELPYKDESTKVFNTWNPYGRNHWGYMTNYFFAPEAFYATNGSNKPGDWNGTDGRQVREMKELVKALHKNGIAVLIDVVYNHVSQYDLNPFKYLDKHYYFRLNEAGEYLNDSGCGNDFKSERAMARRMIIDSLIYWMQEYHIDGFRFDLAHIIDWETCEHIRDELRKVNPNVILIAEPWGGGYDPGGFSNRDWAAWNDKIRNGIKGWDPEHDRGFIFGEWQGENNLQSLRNFAVGTLQQNGGPFAKAAHAVNYLESHDNHTLGDFIRIGLGEVDPHKPVENPDTHFRLTPKQLRLNKLAALSLFCAQGPVMFHEGQEYARSKVIAPTDAPDVAIGYIDHNSYEKDDETNWLNFDHAEANLELVAYYRGLIALRKAHRALRYAKPEHFHFANTSDPLFMAYLIEAEGESILVALNGNMQEVHDLDLPDGEWELYADGQAASADKPSAVLTAKLKVAPSSGCLLIKR